MSKVEEIEAAIRTLSPSEKEQLTKDLPLLLPEMDGDSKWEKIIRGGQARPALAELIGEVESEYLRDQNAFREIDEKDFDRAISMLARWF